MVTKKEMIASYEQEIAFQKHMLENLGRWFNLMFLLASLGFVIIYFSFRSSLFGMIAGVILALCGMLAMLIVGYGIYRGRLNIQKLLVDFDKKCP